MMKLLCAAVLLAAVRATAPNGWKIEGPAPNHGQVELVFALRQPAEGK